MSNRFVEWLRSFLRKTVLPIRRRREKFFSKFRFSISFRIALNYIRFFILYGILFVAFFILVIMFTESQEKFHMAREYLKDVEENGYPDATHAKGYFDGLGVTYRVLDENGYSILNNTGDEINRKYFFSRLSYNSEDRSLYLKRTNKIISNEHSTYILEFYINMDQTVTELRRVLLPIIILMIAMMFFIIRSGTAENERLMEPINIMSRTANRLTVNSLNQERLNIEGTQNELKDLAETINEMLDRLDTSYESQKQFVSDASHELRTPIAVIQGYINMLDRWGKKDEAVMEESIEAIKNEAASMHELVEKLLFLSRHDKKTMKLSKKFFEMSEVVDDMVKETRLVAEGRNIECEALDKVMVYGDQQALKQAVRVFIDNAVKYTKEGGSICISCRNNDGDCVISVEDTGLGMSQKDLDHVFERFYRADNVRNEKISGHGLGLSIAKLIVLKHSGIIDITSQEGVGTKIDITIPKFKLW